jgi:hypothetical protein
MRKKQKKDITNGSYFHYLMPKNPLNFSAITFSTVTLLSKIRRGGCELCITLAISTTSTSDETLKPNVMSKIYREDGCLNLICA